MRIVLKQEKKLYVLENLISFIFEQDTNNKVRINYQCHIDVDKEITSVMLANMSFELQTQHGNKDAHIIIMYLKELFDVASSTQRYETSKKLLCHKMIEGSLINIHVLRMIGCFRKLDQLSFVMDNELSVDLILQSKQGISF